MPYAVIWVAGFQSEFQQDTIALPAVVQLPHECDLLPPPSEELIVRERMTFEGERETWAYITRHCRAAFWRWGGWGKSDPDSASDFLDVWPSEAALLSGAHNIARVFRIPDLATSDGRA